MTNEFYNMDVSPDDLGYYPLPGRDWELERPPEPLTFFGFSRGVARFGLLFSGSLLLTLTVRLIPGLTPAYLTVLGVGVATAAIYGAMARSTGQRITALIILVLCSAGVLAGYWDAIHAILSDASGQKLALQVGIVGALMGAVALLLWLIQVGRDR